MRLSALAHAVRFGVLVGRFREWLALRASACLILDPLSVKRRSASYISPLLAIIPCIARARGRRTLVTRLFSLFTVSWLVTFSRMAEVFREIVASSGIIPRQRCSVKWLLSDQESDAIYLAEHVVDVIGEPAHAIGRLRRGDIVSACDAASPLLRIVCKVKPRRLPLAA